MILGNPAPKKEFPSMQRVLRLILAVPLGSLTACHIGPVTTSRTSEAPTQSTRGKTSPQLPSNKLEGHYEGIKLEFYQDSGSSNPVAIDIEPTGACQYSDPIWFKRPCRWERSTNRITVSVTQGGTVAFQMADDKLTYLTRDGAGGGVCIQLVKGKAVSDTGADLCRGVMMGLPLPPPK
jgi:hypothetical protein